jgi:hypothetical protein
LSVGAKGTIRADIGNFSAAQKRHKFSRSFSHTCVSESQPVLPLSLTGAHTVGAIVLGQEIAAICRWTFGACENPGKVPCPSAGLPIEQES